MDYNISDCITTIKKEDIVIDETKFKIVPLELEGDEFADTELGTLVCDSKL